MPRWQGIIAAKERARFELPHTQRQGLRPNPAVSSSPALGRQISCMLRESKWRPITVDRVIELYGTRMRGCLPARTRPGDHCRIEWCDCATERASMDHRSANFSHGLRQFCVSIATQIADGNLGGLGRVQVRSVCGSASLMTSTSGAISICPSREAS
jgi:hypothetical protein